MKSSAAKGELERVLVIYLQRSNDREAGISMVLK